MPRAPDPSTPLLSGLAPVLDDGVRLVVLGSFPGVASLAAAGYYAHPRNQFWPIVSALIGTDLTARDDAGRRAGLLAAGVGLWDVHARCRRPGSLDSDIVCAEPNDLLGVLGRLPRLRGIVHNGGESARALPITRQLGLPTWRLPSTSPANASWSFARKLQAWRAPFEACGVALAEPAAGGPQPDTPSIPPRRRPADPAPE